jgi:hypothetical protein
MHIRSPAAAVVTLKQQSPHRMNRCRDDGKSRTSVAVSHESDQKEVDMINDWKVSHSTISIVITGRKLYR